MEYTEEIRCLLWLVMVFGAGNPKIWEILRHHETPQKSCAALQASDASAHIKLDDKQWRRIRQTKAEQVEMMLKQCHSLDISILWYGDEAYPEQLYAVVNAPVLLFYQGDISLLQDHLLLTVVGTREPTEYSLRVEKQICGELVVENFVLVTGFAAGIDITANLCAIQAGKPSIALMGCGLDVNYPRTHFNLKREIAKNGLILSEFLPGTSPRPSNFPLRNRVLSGLSMGTMVIQAPSRSGALITAACALEQGRDVFCVPPADIFDKRYQGVVKYLRDGATPVFDSRDIVYAYYTSHAHMIDAAALYEEKPKMSESMVMTLGEPKTSSSSKHTKKKSERGTKQASEQAPTPELPTETEIDETPETESMDAASEMVLKLIQKSQVVHLDMIATETGLPMDQLIVTLTELELLGKIERIPGKQFRII